MLIFKKSHADAYARAQAPQVDSDKVAIKQDLLRQEAIGLPALSELEVIRHYTRLSQKNFSIDTNFYPLGSCTMKYNPRAAHKLASLREFSQRHPLNLVESSQGFLQCMYELQDILCEVTGMQAISLAPMAGAQGEFAGVAMIKAYHQDRNDTARTEILVPDAAHGTNPASAVMCGYQVKEIKTAADGDIDLEDLKAKLGPQTAGIMLTNPSTLGVFERQIKDIAQLVHQAGGLLYYDGANLNAVLGKVRPGDMGFDVMHLNLHKTFATPHGGGGPGAGPVAVGERLVPYLPTPRLALVDGQYQWCDKNKYPRSIGRMNTFMGNAGILLRAYVYAKMLGAKGLTRVAEFATLNANYIMQRLADLGYTLAYPKRRASHEFIVTLSPELKTQHVSAMDVAKRLLDYDIHAPTTYFPLLVPECLLIEPTETESKQMLDHFVDVMAKIFEEIKTDPELVQSAPHTLPVKRLDDVKAARELDLVYQDS